MFRSATLASAALALVVLPGIVLAQSQEPFRLILTHLEAPLVPNSVMDVAHHLGYFADEGVTVDLVRVQQTPSALAALQSGSGEMANVGVDALLQTINAGVADLRAVASPNKSLPFLIAARAHIETIDDLEGASFGIGRVGSLDHSLSSLVLDQLGFAIDRADLVTLGQPSIRAQALAAERIDATTFSIGVWAELPEKDGLHILVDQDAYYRAAPVINKVNAVPESILEQRPDEVAAVLRALVRISRDIAADPQIWVDAMTELRPDIDADLLETLVADFGASWSVNGGMSAAELGYTQDWLYRTEDFAGLPALELSQWVAFEPLDAVLADMGIIDGPDPADR